MFTMRIVLLSCLLESLMIWRVHAAIVADISDFIVDCGTDSAGHVSVTYINRDPVNNKVKKMSGPNNRDTCKAGPDIIGIITISDVRADCDIHQPDANVAEFLLQLTLQEFDGVYQNSDPTFLFRCFYSVENPSVSTDISDAGPVGIPTIVHLNVSGKPHMQYFLNIVDPTNAVLTGAKFGQQVVLQVTMTGTDKDEQGVQVQSCNVSSGSVSLSFIENFCVVPDKAGLFNLPGFVSSATEASFPITLFALEGSESSDLIFECVIRVCSRVCAGQNCRSPSTGRRKRRATGITPKEDKTVIMATQIEILPNAVASSVLKVRRTNRVLTT